MLYKIKLLFSLNVFSLLFLLFLSHQTYGESRRVHAGACHTEEDWHGTDIYNSSAFSNYNSTFHIAVLCNIPSDSSLSFAEIARLNLHGYKPSSELNHSRACYYNLYTNTHSCGASKNWGDGYAGASNVDTSVWLGQSTNTFGIFSMPYIYTLLGPGSKIHGYYFRD